MTWLGRALCTLPREGDDVIPQVWPVVASAHASGPMPQALSIGFEWLSLTDELAAEEKGVQGSTSSSSSDLDGGRLETNSVTCGNNQHVSGDADETRVWEGGMEAELHEIVVGASSADAGELAHDNVCVKPHTRTFCHACFF